MSGRYRCRIKLSVVEDIKVSDEIEYKLEFLDILPEEEMMKLYRKTLGELGKENQTSKNFEIELECITIILSPSEKKAVARISSNQRVNISDMEGKSIEYRKKINKTWAETEVMDVLRDAKERLEQNFKDMAKKEIDAIKQKELKKINKILENSQDKIKRKLREITNEVHKAAFRKKASILGRISSDNEEMLQNGDNRLTIDIEL